MSRQKSDMPWWKNCSHPGCTSRMHKNTSTYDAGLCAKHGGRHLGKAGTPPIAAPVVPVERPGVRVVEVATISSCGSAAGGGRAKVSLAREPWNE